MLIYAIFGGDVLLMMVQASIIVACLATMLAVFLVLRSPGPMAREVAKELVRGSVLVFLLGFGFFILLGIQLLSMYVFKEEA